MLSPPWKFPYWRPWLRVRIIVCSRDANSAKALALFRYLFGGWSWFLLSDFVPATAAMVHVQDDTVRHAQGDESDFCGLVDTESN
jgi:hypothetical protein